MNLKELIAHDINNLFFKDASGFSDSLTIGTNSQNAVHVFGSLQVNEVQNNSGNGAPLANYSHTLLCPVAPLANVPIRANGSLYIDGVAYRIISFHNEMGVYTMLLQKG